MPTLEIGTWARINEDQVSKVMPLTRMIGQPQLCRQCDRAPLPEDDGSTAPTDDTP